MMIREINSRYLLVVLAMFCTPMTVHALCGDGIIDDDEGCDDGDTVAGSGCTTDCQIVSEDWICNGPPPQGLINASFEADEGRSYIPDGWSISSDPGVPLVRDEVDVIDVVTDGTISDWVAQDGQHILDLNGSDTSNLFQDIQTVPGNKYNFEWYDSQAPTVDGGRVYIVRIYNPNGNENERDFATGGNSTVTVVDQPQPWRKRRLSFTATSLITRIHLISLTSLDDDDGALFDDLSVYGGCNLIPGCGNGVTEVNEGCDKNDPFYLPLGTCNEFCQLRLGAECNRDIECETNFCRPPLVEGEPSVCSFCGNFEINENEGCDLGPQNGVFGSTCTASCLLVTGESCNEDAQCDSGLCNDITGLCDTCGNGILDDNEPCDFAIGDGIGCTARCLLTDGGQCQVDRECENGSCIRPVENLPGICTLCGNGVVDLGEACDPLTDESCNSSCLIQDGFECTNDEMCASNFCAFAEEGDETGRCLRCGNNVVERELGEECDGSPGCSSQCTLTQCGNGRLESGESCDDGNTSALDGCDSICVVEPGYTCEVSEDALVSVCRETLCGDGIIAEASRSVAGGIKCDDGNMESGDGCSQDCLVEDGWICGSEPSICVNPIECGNGLVDINRGEQCDDNNEENGDGCSENCLVEDGWLCDDGLPSACVLIDSGDAGVTNDFVLTGGGDGCDCREAPFETLAVFLCVCGLFSRRRRGDKG